MRFEAIHIDGFGVFCDLNIAGLSPKLNVFLGENEAGKTTLLAFLRAILFGFPPGQRRENVYPPLAGGRHGGRLTMLNRIGEQYVVTRHYGPKRGPVTVTLADGSQGDQAVLGQLTGAATEDLFRSVFAFSLSELQDFHSLNNQEVRAAIYSAGAGMGRVSLSQVEKRLKSLQEALFKPGGRRPSINKLFRELHEVNGIIQAKQDEIDRYDELREELSQVEARVAARRKRLATSRSRLDRVGLLERAWEDWVSLSRIQEERADLPVIEAFPEDGVNRLEKLQERLRLLNRQRGELEDRIDQSRERMQRQESQPQWLSVAEQIRVLERGLDRFSANSEELTGLRARIENERQTLANDLMSLGPDWDLDILDRFDTSISAREQIRAYIDRLNRAREVQRKAESKIEQFTDVVQRAETKTREAETTLGQIPEPEEKNPTVLLERRRLIRAMNRLIHKARELQIEFQHVSERGRDLSEQEVRLCQELDGIEWTSVWWLAPLVPSVFGVCMGVGRRWGWQSAWMVAAGGLILCLMMLLLILRWRRSQEADADSLERQLTQVRGKLTSTSVTQTDLTERITKHHDEIEYLATTLGVGRQPTPEATDQLETEIEAEQESLNRWQNAYSRFVECKNEWQRLQKERDNTRETLANSQKQLRAAEENWQTWLREAGLDESFSPTAALEAMERIRSLRQQARSVGELEARLVSLEQSVSCYQEEAAATAEKVEDGEFHELDIGILVTYLITGLEGAEKAQRSLEMLERELKDCESQHDQNIAHLREIEKEMQALFSEGEAEDEAQFRRRAHLYEQRIKAKTASEQHLRNLEKLGGRGQDQVLFQNELSDSSPERLREEKEAMEQEVHELEEELASLQEHQGRLDERCKQLEATEELAVLRLQRNALLTELSDAAQSWSVLVLCRHFLREAQQVYERERKQPVVRESERFFRAITGGKYQTVVAPHGEERIQVIGANGSRCDLGILSRGTAEQLYLSVRFGYIREFGRRARPLPVVMDDIFVNFDPKRARAAISAMLELARDNQVLFFTCHPETVSLIKELDQDTPVWRLEDGQCMQR